MATPEEIDLDVEHAAIQEKRLREGISMELVEKTERFLTNHVYLGCKDKARQDLLKLYDLIRQNK